MNRLTCTSQSHSYPMKYDWKSHILIFQWRKQFCKKLIPANLLLQIISLKELSKSSHLILNSSQETEVCTYQTLRNFSFSCFRHFSDYMLLQIDVCEKKARSFLYSLILSVFFGLSGAVEQVNSLTICLSSSDLLSHLLHGNMYFLFLFTSKTSIQAQCHAAPKPGENNKRI